MHQDDIKWAEEARESAQRSAQRYDAQERSIYDWLYESMADDAAMAIEKRRKYGSADLVIMGEAMAALRDDDISQAEGIEMAIGFYIMGKAARLFGAWARGELPDVDSYRDLAVYGYMARRVRAEGEW